VNSKFSEGQAAPQGCPALDISSPRPRTQAIRGGASQCPYGAITS
jgi:hypothetical protein